MYPGTSGSTQGERNDTTPAPNATANASAVSSFTTFSRACHRHRPRLPIRPHGTGVLLGVALLVGLSTLRLAGVYFVIFSFGLAELIRQLVTWFETAVTGTLGRYIFLPLGPEHIYWQLLALCAVTLAITWWVDRSKLGMALRVIADDEVVASHIGIDIARTKIALFVISAVIITLVGAIQAPRWTYVEPAIVFNPTVSFLTLIMALLGGASRLWGPALGAIPLFLLFEWLSANFPNHYSILLGVLFIVIVFLLPKGVMGLAERLRSVGTRENPARNGERSSPARSSMVGARSSWETKARRTPRLTCGPVITSGTRVSETKGVPLPTDGPC